MSSPNYDELRRLINNPATQQALANARAQLAAANQAMTQFADFAQEIVKSQETALQHAIEAVSQNIPPNLSELIEEHLNAVLPENWPRPMPDPGVVEHITQDDGIPIVHIPRAEIVQQLVDSAGFDDRIEIIEARVDEILEDCAKVLEFEPHENIAGQHPLVVEAVEAFQAGFVGSAQALAVTVCDTYLKRFFEKNYSAMIEKATLDDDSKNHNALILFNYLYPMATIVPFLTPFFPDEDATPPSMLSRHVTIHFASVEHVHRLNATVAVMLATSLTVTYHKAFSGGWLHEEESHSSAVVREFDPLDSESAN